MKEITLKILQNNLTLESYFLLKSLVEGEEFHISLGLLTSENLRRLKRLDYIDKESNLTDKAFQLFDENHVVESKEKVKTYTDLFEEFWSTYPTTDKWGIFPQTRTLRYNKSGAYKVYQEILKEGVSAELILKALKNDIEIKKKTSLIENKLSFLQNCVTWLRQRIFEGYEEPKETAKETGYGEDVV